MSLREHHDRDRRRVERLVETGALEPAEAQEFLATLGRLQERAERVTAAAPAKGPSRNALTKLAVLRGQIGVEEYVRMQKRIAVRMGLAFGLLTAVIHVVMVEMVMGGQSFSRALVVGLSHLILGGPLFGWAMYRCWLRPSARRLATLVESSGAPLESPAVTPPGRCPTCAAENFKTWGKNHLMQLHWTWNPGLAFNELVLGQRVPAEMFACDECGSHWIECHSCDRAVDTALWSPRQNFGRWSGVACPHCSKTIPCLRNVWAGILLLPLRVFGLVGDSQPARS